MEIQYGIINIEETQFSYNYDFDYSTINPETDLAIQLGHELKVNTQKGEIIIAINVDIVTSESKQVLVRNITRYTFNVKPFEEFYKGTTDQGIEVTIPRLMDTFLNISIGAARGILAKNLKGTPLQACVLPLIPMDELSKQAKISKAKNK